MSKEELRDKVEALSVTILKNEKYDFEEILVNQSKVLELINQLDEPETLSQEWIESKTWNNHYVVDPFVFVDDLQEVLVPKQEEVTEEAHEKYGMSETRWKEVIERYKWHLEQEGYAVIERPIIPQFVADWLEAYRDGWELYISIEEAINYERFDGRTKESDAQSEEMQHWLLNADNQELYARAWLVGYTVEDKKYYVLDSEDIPLLRKVIKGFGIDDRQGKIVSSTKPGESSDTRLTEQEIKDYDERYFAFAVPVEEEEE